ncbi:MAG: LuxR C-terminal-related transcriptional regulator, partial [Bacteroidota bacterium]
VIFITGHGDIPMGVEAMKRGAVDFLPKPFTDEELLGAIRLAVARRQTHAQRERAVLDANRKALSLTSRELEVMRCVVAGMMNKEAASSLRITEKTVKEHRGRVMTKTNVQSVAALVALARDAGVSPYKRPR